MKKSTRAALLSAFIFPGAGHLYLKKYIPGTVLAGISFIALYQVVSETVEQAYRISEQLLNGTAPLDAGAITELIAGQSAAAGTQSLNIAMSAFLLCWLIGIIDSYRAGRAQAGAK